MKGVLTVVLRGEYTSCFTNWIWSDIIGSAISGRKHPGGRKLNLACVFRQKHPKALQIGLVRFLERRPFQRDTMMRSGTAGVQNIENVC